MGCVTWFKQSGGMAGDIMGCWKTVVTVVEEQREEAMGGTSVAVPSAALWGTWHSEKTEWSLSVLHTVTLKKKEDFEAVHAAVLVKTHIMPNDEL